MKSNDKYPDFTGWGKEYAAFSVSEKNKAQIINYIKSQKEHHKTYGFADELRQILQEHGVQYDEKWFMKD